MWTKRMLNDLLFCNSYVVIWNFIFVMQFILSCTLTTIIENLFTTRVHIALTIKICIKLMMIFFDKSWNTCDQLFYLFHLKWIRLLMVSPQEYYLYSGACINCKWINIEFDCWTWYSSEFTMCHYLTALISLFLLLNIYSTSNSDPPKIHIWLSI
jgi:hypothetical protein